MWRVGRPRTTNFTQEHISVENQVFSFLCDCIFDMYVLHFLYTEASREIQAKLEMETHQQADELDIAKEKVILISCLYFLCSFVLFGVIREIMEQRLLFLLFVPFLSLCFFC